MPDAATTTTATESAPARESPPPAVTEMPLPDGTAAAGEGGRGAIARQMTRPGARVALLATLSGLLWGQLLLLASPEAPPAQTLALALKAGLGVWVLLTLAGAAVALTRPRPPAGAYAPPGRLATAAPLAVVAGTVLAVAALTIPATSRLAATALCYLILAAALGWLVWRRAGPAAATSALVAF